MNIILFVNTERCSSTLPAPEEGVAKQMNEILYAD